MFLLNITAQRCPLIRLLEVTRWLTLKGENQSGEIGVSGIVNMQVNVTKLFQYSIKKLFSFLHFCHAKCIHELMLLHLSFFVFWKFKRSKDKMDAKCILVRIFKMYKPCIIWFHFIISNFWLKIYWLYYIKVWYVIDNKSLMKNWILHIVFIIEWNIFILWYSIHVILIPNVMFYFQVLSKFLV